LFSASYYHKLLTGVEAGAKASWNKSKDSGVTVEFATKYALDKDAFVKVMP
jgi:voltage-dependent anion channel protein 2